MPYRKSMHDIPHDCINYVDIAECGMPLIPDISWYILSFIYTLQSSHNSHLYMDIFCTDCKYDISSTFNTVEANAIS